MALNLIHEEIENCTKCPLHQYRITTVPGSGPADAEVVFIGEGPGPDEDAQGIPFIGRAGKVLRGLVLEVGLKLDQVFFVNLVKCMPTDGVTNRRGTFQFREPNPIEIAECKPFLDRQLAELQDAKVVMPLGRVPTWEWYPGVSMGDIHGVIRNNGQYLLVPTYHPSAVARGNAHFRELMLADIKRACEYAGVLKPKSRSGL